MKNHIWDFLAKLSKSKEILMVLLFLSVAVAYAGSLYQGSFQVLSNSDTISSATGAPIRVLSNSGSAYPYNVSVNAQSGCGSSGLMEFKVSNSQVAKINCDGSATFAGSSPCPTQCVDTSTSNQVKAGNFTAAQLKASTGAFVGSGAALLLCPVNAMCANYFEVDSSGDGISKGFLASGNGDFYGSSVGAALCDLTTSCVTAFTLLANGDAVLTGPGYMNVTGGSYTWASASPGVPVCTDGSSFLKTGGNCPQIIASAIASYLPSPAPGGTACPSPGCIYLQTGLSPSEQSGSGAITGLFFALTGFGINDLNSDNLVGWGSCAGGAYSYAPNICARIAGEAGLNTPSPAGTPFALEVGNGGNENAAIGIAQQTGTHNYTWISRAYCCTNNSAGLYATELGVGDGGAFPGSTQTPDFVVDDGSYLSHGGFGGNLPEMHMGTTTRGSDQYLYRQTSGVTNICAGSVDCTCTMNQVTGVLLSIADFFHPCGIAIDLNSNMEISGNIISDNWAPDSVLCTNNNGFATTNLAKCLNLPTPNPSVSPSNVPSSIPVIVISPYPSWAASDSPTCAPVDQCFRVQVAIPTGVPTGIPCFSQTGTENDTDGNDELILASKVHTPSGGPPNVVNVSGVMLTGSATPGTHSGILLCVLNG